MALVIQIEATGDQVVLTNANAGWVFARAGLPTEPLGVTRVQASQAERLATAVDALEERLVSLIRNEDGTLEPVTLQANASGARQAAMLLTRAAELGSPVVWW